MKRNGLRFITGSFFFCMAVYLTLCYHVWYTQLVAGVCLAITLLLSAEGGLQKKVKKTLERFFSDFVEKIASFFSVRGFAGEKEEHIIRGYRDEIERTERNVAKKEAGKRYRDRDAREKVRYWYVRMLRREMKRGYSFAAFLTPGEICREWKEGKRITLSKEQLFSMYQSARYDETSEITETEAEIAKACFKKKKDMNI